MPRNKLATALGGVFEGLATGIQMGTQRRVAKEQISASKLSRLTGTLALLPVVTKNMGEAELNNLSDLVANEFGNVIDAPPEQLKGIANKLVRAEPERLQVLANLDKEFEKIGTITNPDEKTQAMNNHAYKLIGIMGSMGALTAEQTTNARLQFAKLVGDQEQLRASLYNQQRTRKLAEDKLINSDITNYMASVANDPNPEAKSSLMRIMREADVKFQTEPVETRRARIAETVSDWKTYYQRTGKYPTLDDVEATNNKLISDINNASKLLNNTNPIGKERKPSIFDRMDAFLGLNQPSPEKETYTIPQSVSLLGLKPKRKPYKPIPTIEEIDLSNL